MKNPILSYFGGKWKIRDFIISNLPHEKHYNVYCEPYAGGFSVGLSKKLVAHNYYNDIDKRVVNFFQVIREQKEELIALLNYTPYSRVEFERCIDKSPDSLEDARRIFVIFNQGRKMTTRTTGSQWKRSKSSNTSICNAFVNKIYCIDEVCEILKRHYIESKGAIEIIGDLDSDNTLFYIDPPYVWSTRTSKNCYGHEINKGDHASLLKTAQSLSSYVLISGYDNDMYNEYLKGWRKKEIEVHDSHRSDQKIIETIWMNYPEEISKKEEESKGRDKQLSLGVIL